MSGTQPYATMVTNFDSTEQRTAWERFLKDDKTAPSIRNLWIRDDSQRPCEWLLNSHTELATYFAGVIRTAYLYCNRIMLTDAQLFDGIFFLALGPTIVNGILGKSYKDGPAIIVSGRKKTLKQCLKAFTISTIANVQRATNTETPSAQPENPNLQRTTNHHTIRPLEYCVYGHTVSPEESLGQPESFYASLDERLAKAQRGEEKLTTVIAQAYACALCPEENPTSQYRFLAQRWQEWLDAEQQGLILYENQNDVQAQNRANSEGFNKHFAHYASDYAPVLRKKYRLSSPESTNMAYATSDANDNISKFATTLEAIAAMPKRSDAFTRIEQSKLPDGGSHEPCDTNQSHRPSSGTDSKKEMNGPQLTQRALRDWYQFVYQRSLARHLGAHLIAVSTPPNSFEQMVAADQRTRRSSLVLTGKITDRLGGMPATRFSTFRYESRSAIKRWQQCTPVTSQHEQRVSTRNVAYAVQQATEERSLVEDGKNMLWGTLLAGILALLSALTDNIWLNGNAPLWLIVLAAWSIAVVPNLIDVAQWLWDVHSTSKTVVYLQ
ncbi:hypothetical protein [Bifidobacterium panos]|uniref:Uncharacterized protein n=1 Tax=Bifidobacterium panos TaxID=2675321 RepID=A0ABX1SX91_9BIFI|nr:hypothetical protein [Bifidobacterium sp. DSM 109963]NMN02450.1 hypothetical protein [Bifidobacterium sp. DSM 109963]